MEQTHGTITRNVTTTLQAIDLRKIFGTREVVVINNDEDNNIFYNPNPSGVAVLTADVDINVSGVGIGDDNLIYEIADADIGNFAVGDLVTIATTLGTIYETKITAVDSTSETKTVTIEAVSGLAPADDDTITARCYKLPSHIVIRTTDFQTNKFLVKHKDNVATDLYQLIFVDSSVFSSSKAPFFFAK